MNWFFATLANVCRVLRGRPPDLDDCDRGAVPEPDVLLHRVRAERPAAADGAMDDRVARAVRRRSPPSP